MSSRGRFAIVRATFYEDLAQRLTDGALEGFREEGIELVQVQTGIPCAFGVLTVENLDQALARSGGDKRDQGYNAALVVVRMSRLLEEIATPSP